MLLHSTQKLPKQNLIPFLTFLFPLSIIFFTDAILSYSFPIILEQSLNSPLLMGFIMSMSSVFGLACDFLFPNILAKWKWYSLIFATTVLTALFTVFVHLSSFTYPLIFGLLAVASWGIYYELMCFSEDKFIVFRVLRRDYTRIWSIIGFMTLFMWIVGPIIAEKLLEIDLYTHTSFILILQGIAIFFSSVLVLISYFSKNHEKHFTHKRNKKIGITKILNNFRHLVLPLLPVLIPIFAIKFLESCYWMFGALFAISLGGEFAKNEWLILLLYTVPLVMGNLLLSYLHNNKNKKFRTYLGLCIGGLFTLIALCFTNNFYIFIAILGFANIFFANVTPLLQSVVSGLERYLGEEKQLYITSVVSMSGSFSYVVSPVLGGLIVSFFGYNNLFLVAGAFTFLVGTLCLFFLKKSIRLDRSKIV